MATNIQTMNRYGLLKMLVWLVNNLKSDTLCIIYLMIGMNGRKEHAKNPMIKYNYKNTTWGKNCLGFWQAEHTPVWPVKQFKRRTASDWTDSQSNLGSFIPLPGHAAARCIMNQVSVPPFYEPTYLNYSLSAGGQRLLSDLDVTSSGWYSCLSTF